MTINRILWALAAIIVLVGCAPTTREPSAPSPGLAATAEPPSIQATAISPPESVLPTPVEGEVTRPVNQTPFPEDDERLDAELIIPVDPAAKGHISIARRNLAERLGLDAAKIEIVTYEQVVWRDGSLGCPQPGMMYTQALVDGYLIRLRAGDEYYNYHGARGRDPFLCSSGLERPDSLVGPEQGPD